MIFWLDLETTGLHANECTILEVALIVTEDNLTIRKEYQAVIQQTQTAMDNMNDWCKTQHKKSGLIDEVWGPNSKPFNVVQDELNEIMNDYFSPNDRPLLAGSSIHFDRDFLKEHIKYFEGKLHYRMLDVSVFKEGLRRAFGFELPKNRNPMLHRAMPDIQTSLEDYKAYLRKFKV